MQQEENLLLGELGHFVVLVCVRLCYELEVSLLKSHIQVVV